MPLHWRDQCTIPACYDYIYTVMLPRCACAMHANHVAQDGNAVSEWAGGTRACLGS